MIAADAAFAIRVTRRLPPAVEDVLSMRLSAELNAADLPPDRNGLGDAMRRYGVLVPTIADRIDADLFAMDGLRVKLIANFDAGIDRIDLVAAKRAGAAVRIRPTR